MLEATIAVSIAVLTGMASLTQRLHNRINDLDKRVDGVELRVAQQYVTKEDLGVIISRMEGHMSRIEDKLDTIVLNLATDR